MFSSNLKYYRLKMGMTKQKLAELCGVTPMAISNYEKGKRNPDISVIKRMAEALNVNVSDFLVSRNASLVFKHEEFRKASTFSKTEQEFVKQAVEEELGRFFNAVDCLGGNPIPDPPTCRSLEYSGDFEEDAIKLRGALNFGKTGPIDEIIVSLENKGFLIIEIDLDNSHFSGINGTVNDYPYIAINKNMTVERKRSTIAHELAHIMFEQTNSIDTEKMATAISGAFLIPRQDLIQKLGLRRNAVTKDMIMICEEYAISLGLLVIRANQNNIITDSVKTNYFVKASKADWRKNEPSWTNMREEPRLFKQLVYRAINEHEISIQKGAELLRIPYGEVADYCMEVPSGVH